MEKVSKSQGEWTRSTFFCLAMIVWFCSSLLSQAAYVAFYGVPYDAIALLKQFGPLYYAVIIVELMMWVGVGSVVFVRFAKKLAPKFQSPLPLA
tara:strand:+ start:5238 stop:5519 length:282 start_codon:yes stop_codon:yes gene_type:complete